MVLGFEWCENFLCISHMRYSQSRLETIIGILHVGLPLFGMHSHDSVDLAFRQCCSDCQRTPQFSNQQNIVDIGAAAIHVFAKQAFRFPFRFPFRVRLFVPRLSLEGSNVQTCAQPSSAQAYCLNRT